MKRDIDEIDETAEYAVCVVCVYVVQTRKQATKKSLCKIILSMIMLSKFTIHK